MNIRFAREDELEQVNQLRRQVNDVHVQGRPDIFKPGFPMELQNYLYEIYQDPNKDILVAEREGKLLGFACLQYVIRPENPFMKERRYLDVDEFCVSEGCQRQGIGKQMMQKIQALAREKGFSKIELNMWEFNQGALKFYEAIGFSTYRRYMEMPLDNENA